MNILQMKNITVLLKQHNRTSKVYIFPLYKALEKQIKTSEDQGEKSIKALEEHGKQQVKYSDEKYSLTHLKQKNIFEELTSRRMEEIQNLSKQTDFNNLTYRCKGKLLQKF